MAPDSPPATPRALGGRTVYSNPWMQVREEEFELADGSNATFGVVHKADFAVALPHERGGFWMVEQFRYAIGRRGLEFPAGGWPPGHAGGDALALARAELAEETGLRAGHWQHLGRLHAANGYSPTAFDAFLATDLVAGAPDREPTEADMVTRFVLEDEVEDLIDGGVVVDVVTVAALLLFHRHRRRAEHEPGACDGTAP